MSYPRAMILVLASAGAAIALAVASCSQESTAAIYPTADLRPPGLVAAGPSGPRDILVRFDEPVAPVANSLSVEPRAELSCRAADRDLIVSFGSDQSPGLDYALCGEVDDLQGNRTRFILRFTGWNDRAPRLRLSEAQTGKNGSKAKPHRDYLELEALADGNIGGEEVSWTSTVKTSAYRFPGIEVREGDFIVLHLAPEEIDSERDELGVDTLISGGVDASAKGRDLWCAAQGLPDENGAVSLSLRPGAPPIDGLFYAAEGKAGALGDDKLADMVSRLAEAGIWPLASAAPAWEDGFRWKSSPARSLCRSSASIGASAWRLSASGGQSPGAINADGGDSDGGKATMTKAAARKTTRKIASKKP
jgi:hypothetical protein